MDFQYYPNIENNSFEEQLLKKKEFRNIYPENKNKAVIQQLQPQQQFLKQYISPDTPYNGILIFHGTGVGKTCTAINIAEGFSEYSKKKNKRILILSSSVVKNRFIEEIYNFNRPYTKQCIGDKYIKDIDLSNKKYDEKKRILHKKINKLYEFNGYLEFANRVVKKIVKSSNLSIIDTNRSIQKKISKYYSNRVIIIDEIHNLRKSNNSIDNKKASYIVESIVKYASNIKLVLMSATPMFDSAFEIVYILNLLLLNDNKELIKTTDIFNKSSLKPNAENIIKEKSKGYISYYRSEQPYIFPFRLIPPESKILEYKYDIKGNKLTKSDNLKYTYLYPCPLSDEHYKFYNKEFIGNDIAPNFNTSSNESIGNKKANLFLNISNKFNIIYPTNKGNKFVMGKDGFQRKKNNIGGLYKTTINKNIIYKYQPHASDKHKIPFLDNSRLKTYSSKFHALLNNIISAEGKIFIYINEIETGIIPISLILEQNGYLRYTFKGDLPLLDSKHKQKPRCFLCGKHIEDKIHHKSHENYHSFKVGKYISLSSKNSDVISKAINIFNSDDNKNGDELKIIVGTRVLSEGLHFTGIRQLHIIEPWYNISRLEQVVGRAIRTNSHENLEPIKHNTEIFMYVNTPSKEVAPKYKETETLDISIYRIAEQKDILIKKIEHILKNNAVDCGLFEYTNIIKDTKIEKQQTSRGRYLKYNIKDMPYSRMCDYNKECKMNCKFSISTSNKINTNTYDIKNKTSKINVIKYKIKELINTSYIFNINTVLDYLQNEPEKVLIYKALNDIIEYKDIVVYNKIKGTLIYYNRYYLFQPHDIKNKQVPLYYRNKLLLQHKNSVNINIDDIIVNNKNEKEIVKIDINKILKDYNSLESNIVPYLKNPITTEQQFILFEMIIDRLTIDVYQSIINSFMQFDNKDNIIYKYLNKIYKSSKKKIIINKYKYTIDKESITVSIKKSKDTFKDVPIEYGIFDSKMNKFKIVDSTLDKDIKTKQNKISKKSKSNGRVCTTFDKEYINNVYGRINSKIDILKESTSIGKNKGCSLIEFIFRYLKLTTQKDIYLIYI